MKGQIAYIKAQEIHRMMYDNPALSNENQQKELYSKYFTYIKRSAYLGYREALYGLGQQYEDTSYLGRPNPMYNPFKCVYWYTKACEKGHAEACNNIATFYEKGEGCKKDLQFALELYKRAANGGSSSGKKNYKTMFKDMAIGGKYYIEHIV